MKGYFITGTDTGVGKTLVAGALARSMVSAGIRVGVMKPFETGCRDTENGLIPEDALFLKTMARCSEPLDLICPYRLRHPLAPGVSAVLENVAIHIDDIVTRLLRMQETYDLILVEGAGGLMVPVAENLLNRDLIKIMALPLIIVARLSLGTINHTLLTVHQALSSGINVTGIILNQMSPEHGKAEETNPDVLRRFSPVPIIGQLPFIPEEKRTDGDYLARCASTCINLTPFFLNKETGI